MPLAELYRVVLFAHEISLIQPRLLTDEFFARFRWSCLNSGPSGPVSKNMEEKEIKNTFSPQGSSIFLQQQQPAYQHPSHVRLAYDILALIFTRQNNKLS
jgi:hypothetical protein